VATAAQRQHLHAWAAGLFEGEGCFSLHRPKRDSKHGYVRLIGTLQMTDEDVVRRFAEIVEVGKVHRYEQRGNRQPVWRWTCSGDDTVNVYRLLEPWLLSRRRARFAELLRERNAYAAHLPSIKAAAGRAAQARRRNRNNQYTRGRVA
jgi:hypothetical protein